jgi:prevent-host-death family protein
VTDIPARELSNDVSSVLRRVEAGEPLRVTVSGRPVADLVPLPSRLSSTTWESFIWGRDRWPADPGLVRDLANLLPDTTDDLPVPRALKGTKRALNWHLPTAQSSSRSNRTGHLPGVHQGGSLFR